MQTLDSRADQLRHQRQTLPEIAEIAELTTQRTSLVDRARDAQILVDDLTAQQAKADADVEQVRTRRDRDRQRMDAGQISNPKDLERMQHELVTLERRILALEDAELEVMERLEEAHSTLASLTAEVAAADERLKVLVAERDRKTGDLDEQLGEVAAERQQLVAEMPGELLTLYERLRAAKGGVGAAELRARQCGGCRLTLDNAELAVLRAAPPDEVLRCEECQRILVRTAESGL